MKYAFIGGGNMGRAMASALISSGVCAAKDVLVIDPDATCREACAELGCVVADMAAAAVREAPVVVLAVKPQTSQEAFAQLRDLLEPQQLVVSIMAGITMAAMRAGLNHENLVRVMPNTPAQVGKGMSVYYAAPGVALGQLSAVETLFNACGESLAVHSEDAIDAATAVSGSGPAYVFYVAEHWMRAAQQLGFSAEDAAKLVQQTLLGATALWKAGQVPVSKLREQVTSKGGTTAAALESFESRSVGAGLSAGIERAYQRAKELGG